MFRAVWQYIRGATKGTTAEANVTSTAVDADHQALDVQPYGTTTIDGMVDGDVAHDAADSGNPVKIGGKVSRDPPTAVAVNDRANAWLDPYGRLAGFLPHELRVGGTSAAATNQSQTAAAEVGLSHYLTGYVVTIIEAAAGADIPITLNDGAGEIWRDYIANTAAAGTRVSFAFPNGGLKCTAGNAVSIAAGAPGAGCKTVVNLSYYTK